MSERVDVFALAKYRHPWTDERVLMRAEGTMDPATNGVELVLKIPMLLTSEETVIILHSVHRKDGGSPTP